jgi:MSHA biogenesis protein MshO
MKARGFTIIEMVVALAISGIVVAFAAMFIKAPIDSYLTQSRHATLVDSAGSAWPHIERDLHIALPNSVRQRVNGNVRVLELLTVLDSARYMTSRTAANITTAGTFRGVAHPGIVKYASINNLGTAASNAYLLTNSMTPVNRTITVANGALAGEDVVTISPAFSFPAGDSPKHRLYLVSGPVTYLCDITARTVSRYSGYTIASNQASRDTAAELNAAGATSILVARNVTACSFVAPIGTANHGQIITARFTATRDGQTTTMLHQAEVEPLQ